MTAEQLAELLPVLTAFAERRPVQYRSQYPSALFPRSDGWHTINADTTEFRVDQMNPLEWRVAPTEDTKT